MKLHMWGSHTIPSVFPYSKAKKKLRGNAGENQRGAPTCRRNLTSMHTLSIHCILKFLDLFGFLRHYLLIHWLLCIDIQSTWLGKRTLAGNMGHMVTCTITNSDLNSPCFAWHPYGKLGLFKTELVITWIREPFVCSKKAIPSTVMCKNNPCEQ